MSTRQRTRVLPTLVGVAVLFAAANYYIFKGAPAETIDMSDGESRAVVAWRASGVLTSNEKVFVPATLHVEITSSNGEHIVAFDGTSTGERFGTFIVDRGETATISMSVRATRRATSQTIMCDIKVNGTLADKDSREVQSGSFTDRILCSTIVKG